MASIPRPILPAPGRPGDDRPHPTFTPPPKRQQTAIACEQCRKRKIKCDGGRPSCNNCSRKAISCEYAADPGTGRAGRSVARQEALERDKDALQTQVFQWQELIGYVRARPESEALSIFQRLRQSHNNDPAEVLQMVQTGEALTQLQQSPLSRLEQINSEAWANSPIQVEAQPWTLVAGDGIVSELLSLFFEWEAPFECPMVEPSAFITDLRSRDVRSQYCSSTLVNAICALSCFLCDRIQELDGGQKGSFAARFMEVAERELEKNSKPSFTSVQALYFMFMYGVAVGQDKKYVKYRFTASSMIQTLNLERKHAATAVESPLMRPIHSQIDQEDKETKARVISKGTWGLYCTETIIALAYGQPSLISAPSVPQPFGETLMQIQCELSKCLNDITEYSRSEIRWVGESDDMARRGALYDRLRAQISMLPESDEQDPATSATLHHLTEFYHLSSIILLRPLLGCDTELPGDDIGAPKRACINHCESLVHGRRRLEKSRGLQLSPLWQVLTPATCCFTLVAQLGKLTDERLPELFVDCCAMLRSQTARWPLAVYWLQALHYFALTINAMDHVPAKAMQFLNGLEILGTDLDGDVPVGFIVPMQEELVDLASDSDCPEVSIGKLIEKFNTANLSM